MENQESQPQPKKRPSLIIPALFFVLGFGSVVGFRYFQIKQMAKAEEVETPVSTDSSPTPSPTPFTLQPPGDAVKGQILSMSGDVQMITREADDYAPVATPNAQLRQGEAIAAKENSKADIEFPGVVRTTLSNWGELELVSMLPNNFLVRQKGGKVHYKTLSDNPISVRSFHTLSMITNGEVEIEATSDKITISVISGSVKLGMIDLDNNTQTWTISEQEKAVIDDPTRTVRIGEL